MTESMTSVVEAGAGWTTRPSLHRARAAHDVATVDGRIFVFGGFDTDPVEILDSVEARRRQGDEAWFSRAHLPTARANLAAAELGGTVYVVGGFDRNDAIRDLVEKYDPHTDSWTAGPQVPTPRAAAATAGLGGLLYVAGGFVPLANGDDEPTDSVTAYDPRTEAWTPVAPMPTARARLRLAATGSHLYAIGGQSRNGDNLSIVERYDPQSDTWAGVASMHQSRGVHGVVSITHGSRGLIVVIGGAQAIHFEVTGFLGSTETYDPVTDRWSLLDAQLPRPKAGLVAAAQANGTVLAIGGSVRTNGAFHATNEVHALKLDHHHDG